MSGIEQFLTIGAMVILGLVSMSFNNSVLQNTSLEVENKVILTAYSLGDELIEEMKAKSFDKATINFPTTNPASLTPPSALGKEDSLYDDVDDYNNYYQKISAPHAEDYVVTCKVQYVREDDQDSPSSIQTFYKRAIVTVDSPYLSHSIQLSYIFTLK